MVAFSRCQTEYQLVHRTVKYFIARRVRQTLQVKTTQNSHSNNSSNNQVEDDLNAVYVCYRSNHRFMHSMVHDVRKINHLAFLYIICVNFKDKWQLQMPMSVIFLFTQTAISIALLKRDECTSPIYSERERSPSYELLHSEYKMDCHYTHRAILALRLLTLRHCKSRHSFSRTTLPCNDLCKIASNLPFLTALQIRIIVQTSMKRIVLR